MGIQNVAEDSLLYSPIVAPLRLYDPVSVVEAFCVPVVGIPLCNQFTNLAALNQLILAIGLLFILVWTAYV